MPEKVAEQTSPPASSAAISTDEQQQRNPNNLVFDEDTNGLARCPKKTRDLPNLSECHNCGYRINTTNGRDKLQTLRSEWRIVLLCRKCVKFVNSGELCPYCFSKTSLLDDCFRCRDCSRRIHKHCVLRHGGFAPSSYYCCLLGSGFTICLDCWLPEPLLKLRLRAGFKEGFKSRKVSKSGDGNGGPVVLKDCLKALEDAVNDANSTMEKKVVAASRAREMAAMKSVGARKAVEVANTALEFVSKRDESGTNLGAANTAVDDAELAFQLHRALNSSRRISKNVCSVNSICLALPATILCNGKSTVRAASEFRGYQEDGKCNGGNSNVEKKIYSDKLISSSGDANSLNSICLALPATMLCNGKSTVQATSEFRGYQEDGKCNGYNSNVEKKICSDKMINSSGDANSLETGSQSCGRGNENEIHLNEIQRHCQRDSETKTDRYYLSYRRRKSSMKETPRYTQSCGNEMQPTNIRSHCQLDDTKSDRYYLKYRRRKSSSKSTPRYTQSCGNEMQPNNIQSHCQSDCDTKSDRYYLKYSRKRHKLESNSEM